MTKKSEALEASESEENKIFEALNYFEGQRHAWRGTKQEKYYNAACKCIKLVIKLGRIYNE